MARTGHEVHGEKPNAQLGARFVKDRSGARIDVMPTFLASIGATRVHRMELRALITDLAMRSFAAVLHLHNPL